MNGWEMIKHTFDSHNITYQTYDNFFSNQRYTKGTGAGR